MVGDGLLVRLTVFSLVVGSDLDAVEVTYTRAFQQYYKNFVHHNSVVECHNTIHLHHDVPLIPAAYSGFRQQATVSCVGQRCNFFRQTEACRDDIHKTDLREAEFQRDLSP